MFARGGASLENEWDWFQFRDTCSESRSPAIWYRLRRMSRFEHIEDNFRDHREHHDGHHHAYETIASTEREARAEPRTDDIRAGHG